MKIEIHLLQNFAPSNLNRDDTGAPKDCELGGWRRARISSQCQKRAVREAFRLQGLTEATALGARTKRLAEKVADSLLKKQGKKEDDASRDTELELACFLLESLGLGFERGGDDSDALKSEYLLFLPQRHVDALVNLIDGHRDTLIAQARGTLSGGKKSAPSKEQKKKNRARLPKDLQKEFETILKDASNAPDLALFGRMIADKPDWNLDASCQVAHAISTNRVQMDFDFFTAVDDFKPGDTAGSDMMGTVQFNSSCFYRYAVLDVGALRENLGAEANEAQAQVKSVVEAFLRAFVSAIPTGKQNSMAAHNFPSYALAIVRERGQSISLTNAFLKPARPRGEVVDLVDDSVAKLESYFSRMREPLGGDVVAVCWADRDLPAHPEIGRSGGLEDFYARVASRVFGTKA